jgi:hypothetical protein
MTAGGPPGSGGVIEEDVMAHYKRRKPKNARAGCLLCKPWKANGVSSDFRYRAGELRRIGGKRRRVTKRVDLRDD